MNYICDTHRIGVLHKTKILTILHFYIHNKSRSVMLDLYHSNMNDVYFQIQDLKGETDEVRRGRLFEALIREIMPWDSRPPIVMNPKTEQLDGVFTYKQIHFFIESKGIKKTITPGQQEWEDYELKLRRRSRHVVGLFCSLFSVSKETISRAESLNEQGYTNVILHGKIWDLLFEYQIRFSDYLDYLVLLARVKFKPSTENFDDFNKWAYDTKFIKGAFDDTCKKISSSFLSRFRHHYHDKVYVEREIDNIIKAFSNNLKPNSLNVNSEKETPKQIVVIRDFSGSGKTTLSINLSLGADFAFAFGTTASGNEVDKIFDNFVEFTKFKNDCIKELKAVNKPLLYVIDSLDEVPKMLHNQKRSEVKGLLRKIKTLNEHSVNAHKLKVYPILLVFTIREDYWRDWEAVFEGRSDVLELKRRINNFNRVELNLALEKYSSAYNYKITNDLNQNCKEILSVPINLEMFSEANEYRGNFSIEEIWEGKILHTFFKKKESNIFKHYIEGFTSEHFYQILSDLSYSIILQRNLIFTPSIFRDVLKRSGDQSVINYSHILQLFVSEQILFVERENANNFRFRYIRFVEYFVALHIVRSIKDTRNFEELESYIHHIYDSNIVSIHSILNNIKAICKINYPDLELEIANHYENSGAFLSRHLPRLRGLISRGEIVEQDDLKVLIAKNYTHEPDITWATFFIISAKHNKQSKSVILSAFYLAWETNESRKVNRFRLVDKLGKLGFLIEEKILVCLLNNSIPRDWETYFGFIIISARKSEFNSLWQEMSCQTRFEDILEADPTEWNYASQLLKIILSNSQYVLGDIFSMVPEKTFVDMSQERRGVISDLSETRQRFFQEFLDSFKGAFLNNKPVPYYLILNISNISGKEREQLHALIREFSDDISKKNHSPFINYILENHPRFSELLKCIIQCRIFFDVNGKSKFNETLFQIIYNSDIEHISGFLEYLFLNNYKKNKDDDMFIANIESNPDITREELERIVIAKIYYLVSDPDLMPKISKIERVLFTLYSIISGRIVGFRFTNLIQVVNNALEHYKDHRDLFIQTLVLYDRYEEFLKIQSFRKKIESPNSVKIPQTSEYNEIVRLVFPGLI